MSDSDRFDEDHPEDGPFNPGASFLEDLMRMVGGGSSSPWESAAQIATSVAADGTHETNVDPSDRMAIEQLARVAELHVSQLTGRAATTSTAIEALNRGQWSRRFIEDERGLLEGLSDSIGAALRAQLGTLDSSDPEMGSIPGLPQIPGVPSDQIVQQLIQMLGPMMLGAMAGGTAGQLALRAFGHYEFPLPRPRDRSMTLVLRNIDEFAQAWSLPTEGIRLWICISDVAHHRVLEVTHLRAHLSDLLQKYVSSFTTDPEEMERSLRELDVFEEDHGSEPELEMLQRLAANPDAVLAAIQSDYQRTLMAQISTVVAVIEGYVDWVVDSIGSRLIPEFGRITEALRRRRVEATAAHRYLERLFGLELSQATFDRGADFVGGVIARAGSDALTPLLDDPMGLPTSAELAAPGLWLERMNISATEMDLTEFDDLVIPDYPDLDD